MGSAPTRKVTIVIPTYNRPEILEKTVLKIKLNLQFDGLVYFLIGNDGDDPVSIGAAVGLAFPKNRYHTVLEGPKQGLGANLNMLLKAAETPVVLQMDDDHWLVEPLDITQYYDDLVHPMSTNGWIRLFLGEKKDYYGNQPYYYHFNAANVGPYWYLKPRLTELYIPSNRPHLKRRDFHDLYGFYKEDAKLGNTEEAFCHQFEDVFIKTRPDNPARRWVTIPFFGLTMNQWQHVGDSWQKEGL